MVYGIDGWAFDYGKALHKQEDGCAALTGWTWHNATDTEYAYAYFNLPLVFKAGCVERAIVSAGGPKLACKGLPNIAQRSIQAEMLLESEETMLAELRSQEKARAAESLVLAASLAELERRAQKTDPPIQQDSFTPSYSYSTTLTSSQSYVPMNWTGYGDTITLTWMVTETFPPTTYTTSVPVTKTIPPTTYVTTVTSIRTSLTTRGTTITTYVPVTTIPPSSSTKSTASNASSSKQTVSTPSSSSQRSSTTSVSSRTTSSTPSTSQRGSTTSPIPSRTSTTSTISRSGQTSTTISSTKPRTTTQSVKR